MSDSKTDRARADAIDNAIAAAADPQPGQQVQVEMVQVQVTLNSGRPSIVAVPKDITELELLSFVGQMLALGDQLRSRRSSSRIEMPAGVNRPS